MHRDLKPENILVNEQLDVFLIDFGLARSVPETVFRAFPNASKAEIARDLRHRKHDRSLRSRNLSQHIQSRWYRAPEIILLEKEYDGQIDLWSLGCILGELISLSKEYKHLDLRPSERVMFEGKSCYPLSPLPSENSKASKQVD